MTVSYKEYDKEYVFPNCLHKNYNYLFTMFFMHYGCFLVVVVGGGGSVHVYVCKGQRTSSAVVVLGQTS